VLISHVGIEGALLKRAMAHPKTQEALSKLQAKHEGKVLVAGLDPCQRLSGIALKLLAFERLLTEYECYRDRVVMVQRSLLSGSRAEDEEATSGEVRELVARVNSKFGPVIDYEELRAPQLPIHDRLALWLASDVLVISAIRCVCFACVRACVHSVDGGWGVVLVGGWVFLESQYGQTAD
jgi:trehalose-6-phosphate synthase